MKKVIILLLVALSHCVLMAQQAVSKSIQLNMGIGHLVRQDLSFSPMIHRKWSPVNLQFGYERKTDKMVQHIQAGFNMYKPSIGKPFEYYRDNPENVLTSYRHSFKQVELNYRFLFPAISGDKFNFSFGGRQRNRLVASDYMYAITSSFAYYFSFGLDASFQLNYRIDEKNRISANLNTSIFAFNTRSPYLGIDDQYLEDNYSHNGFKAFLNYIGNGQMQTWDKAQDMDLSVTYEKRISDRWSLIATYYLATNFNQSPTNYNSIQNTLFVGGKLKF